MKENIVRRSKSFYNIYIYKINNKITKFFQKMIVISKCYKAILLLNEQYVNWFIDVWLFYL